MTNPGKLRVTAPTEHEIVMTRLLDAPRELVFDAFTKPELLKRWMHGPPNWSMTVCEIDLKADGAYRYVWRNSNGDQMGMGGVILEMVPPERLVSTEKFDVAWYPGEAVGTILLVEQDGQTSVTQTVRYESREARDAVLKTPMEQGVAMGYDRLAELLTILRAHSTEKGGVEI